eukprot:TRINITY_DN9608_c0_g1_i1.p1 TRINITY_DN9608_c0_g1~~TRINITY_DN9608_c0_g1_i1.p1  ORF type:complete len:166 (-),score=23.56 TRINITY_DN9608_c0_g1_i1:95-592(-)
MALEYLLECERSGDDVVQFHMRRPPASVLRKTFDLLFILATVTAALCQFFLGKNWISLWSVVIWAAGSIRLLFRLQEVTEETLQVMREMGVQVITKTARGSETHLFIDKSKIEAVLINEGITCCQVVFYMTFSVRGHDSMVLAFQHLMPRYDDLLEIYRSTRATL